MRPPDRPQNSRALPLAVVPEPASGLPSQVPGRHQVLEQRRRREAGLAELAVEDLLDRQGAWAARSTLEIGDDIAERVAG